MTRSHPQRPFAPSPPGSLLKRATVPTTTARTSHHGDADLSYLALVRQLPCLHCGMIPSEAAHIRMASAAFGKSSGLGKKPADKFSVPLCAEHHRLGRDAQHARGERQWWEALGINPLNVATLLYEARGDFPRMYSIVHRVISERPARGKT
jgi:hypothetical protein